MKLLWVVCLGDLKVVMVLVLGVMFWRDLVSVVSSVCLVWIM